MQEQKLADAQIQAAEINRKRARARIATGQFGVSAQWSALDDEDHPTMCAITPSDRYYVSQNDIGKTVHDETPDAEWKQIGCERTEPINQKAISDEANRIIYYEETHPLSGSCLIDHIQGLSTGDNALIAKDSKDDCRREPDKYGLAQGDALPSDATAEEHVTTANPPSTPAQAPVSSDDQSASTQQAPIPYTAMPGRQ